MLRTLLSGAVLALSFPGPLAAQSQPAVPNSPPKTDVRPAGIWYGIEKARPKTSGALRLATYNVENLFDQKDDPANPYDQDEMTKPERLESIAKAIRDLDADVLCLQEVESKECLAWFRDTYLKGLGYDHLASEDNGYNRGIEQSVLSRVPIVKATTYSGDDLVISDMEARRTPESAKSLGGTWAPPARSAPPERFQRSPLRVDLRTKDGYPLTVFVVHFKAGRDFDHQRELEALQVEQFVEDELQRDPDANVAVVGDFNGTPGDMNAKALWKSDDGLVSAYDWRFDPKAPRDAFVTHASGRSIDFIVMSPGLAADCVDGSYFVRGTLHAASDWDWRKADEIPPPKGYASDHYPVAIEVMPKPDRPASAFRRAARADAADPAGPDAPAGPKSSAAKSSAATSSAATSSGAQAAPRSELRSDARPPTREEIERHAKPAGAPSAAERSAADAIRAAGWRYVLPAPKSRTAEWPRRGGNSTWWPGYWASERGRPASRTRPEASDGFVGDGAGLPTEFTRGGAPDPVGWIEWLSSTEGASGG